MPRRLLAFAVGTALVATATMACDLRLEPSNIFGGSCEVVVGYFHGQRVGPFHVSLPDGSVATVGSCEGYVGVKNVAGDSVTVEAFHSVPAALYTLADDCRSSVKRAVR
jgi:hypothetical protein